MGSTCEPIAQEAIDREKVKTQIIALELSVAEIASHHGIKRLDVHLIAQEYGIDMDLRYKLMSLLNEKRHIQDQIDQLMIPFKRSISQE